VVRRIPIRVKVAGALAVPLLGLVVAAAVGVGANMSRAGDVTDQADLVNASIAHAGLIGALQNERNLAVIEMQGLLEEFELAVEEKDVAREETDEAATALRASVTGENTLLREDYAAALGKLDDLSDLREGVDEIDPDPGLGNATALHEVFTEYSGILSALFASHDRFSLVIDDAAMRHGDALVRDAFHATDAAARLVEYLIYASWEGQATGTLAKAETAQVGAMRRDLVSYNDAIDASGTGPYDDLVDELLNDPEMDRLMEYTDRAVAEGGEVDFEGLLINTPLGTDDSYLAFRDEVVELVDARTRSLHDEAEAARRLYLMAAVAVVGAAVIVAWWVSRSITRPLRALSVQARDIATDRLPTAVQDILDAPPGEDLVIREPQPIVVDSRDEVADVASAFNDVQHSAIGLAVEQAALRRNVAESYVNLGRRNQSLLSRLLDAVGELEQGETDPRRQAQLYKLDHLATRIRRNAESLLVLSQADADAGSQVPVAVASVVRAALGEVEDHERVLVRSLEPALVTGAASADLAHLLAELIENGLRHSPPRELVEVTGRVAGEGYQINIVDHGLGMTPDEIDRANQRLAGTESFAVTPAKYLGHYVTAVLAARHDITVSLEGSVVVGIAARVVLPPALIVEEGAETPDPSGAADRSVDEVASLERMRNAVSFLRGVTERRAASTVGGPRGLDAVAIGARRVTDLPRRGGEPAPEGDSETIVLPAVTARASGGTPRFNPSTSGNGSLDDAPPERTASGLVRRVRGAHVPAGVAVSRAAPTGSAPLGPADEPSSTPVDGAQIQQFLTSLVGGVQRSLDEQSQATDTEDEG